MRPSIDIRGRVTCVSVGLLAASLCAPTLGLGAAQPHLTARAAGLIEASTGQRLYGLRGDVELPIASTTKIMTALVTLEHVRHLATVFTQTDWRAVAEDSQIGLVPGERMTVHDLLLALLLPSADDAAEDLAFNIGHRSVPRFIAMMNREAARLALKHTHYATPIGFDMSGNYSSAFDLDKLAAYTLAKSPLFERIVAQPNATLLTGPEHHVVNRNDLIGHVPWINGVKTGHTGAAGFTLVASGTRDGMTLIGTVLGTPSAAARDQNALALLDYGFAEFHLVTPVLAGHVLARRPVSNVPGVRAPLVAGGSFVHVTRRSDRVRLRIEVTRRLAGPMARGTVVGRVLVTVGRRVRARVRLLLGRALPSPPPPPTVAGLISGGAPFLALAAVLLAVGTLLRRLVRLRLTARDRMEVE
jgi:D-alanyl-D-alanine carboxypeptidase (penicillin-binding protein 5/6)